MFSKIKKESSNVLLAVNEDKSKLLVNEQNLEQNVNVDNRYHIDYMLREHFIDKGISYKIKIQLYQTRIQTVLLYGAESWVFSQAVFERYESVSIY